MDWLWPTLGTSLFVLLMAMPGLYGLHLYLLMFLAQRRRQAVRSQQAQRIRQYLERTPEECWPHVTTQLPLFNELSVAQRVIEAAAGMDYPAGRHEIQVLDDSTDATRELVDQVCARLSADGHDLKILRRPARENYKAGALAHGLNFAAGELIAVFDADFVPDAGFLRRMVPLLAAQPDAGCVQGRWGHLNERESWITDALAIGMDGHFGVEQGARGWNGLLLNFNGTGGIWRRAAIEDPRVGGWQGDTLTEDLDLSYRAQLAGWKVIYRVDEVCPAEVPAEVDALKAQQRRWATGSIQTARKLLPSVWRSNVSLAAKLEASFHLTQYAVNPFMVLMVLFGRPLLALVPPDRIHSMLAWSWMLILLAAAAPSIAYVYARWSLGGGILSLPRILRLIVLGLGLSLNNAVAVLEGLVQRGGEFARTPKSGSRGQVSGPPPYTALRSRLWLLELGLAAYCLVQWIVFLPHDRYVGGTFLLLFAVGLGALGWGSRPRTWRIAPPAPRKPVAGTVYVAGKEAAVEPALPANL